MPLESDYREKYEGGDSMLYQESEKVELKQDFAESIHRDMIAFVNTNGGIIYIGIKDNGEVSGVSSPDQMIQRSANMA